MAPAELYETYHEKDSAHLRMIAALLDLQVYEHIGPMAESLGCTDDLSRSLKPRLHSNLEVFGIHRSCESGKHHLPYSGKLLEIRCIMLIKKGAKKSDRDSKIFHLGYISELDEYAIVQLINQIHIEENLIPPHWIRRNGMHFVEKNL